MADERQSRKRFANGLFLTNEDAEVIYELIVAAAGLVGNAIPGELHGSGQDVYLVDRESLQRLYLVVSMAMCSKPNCASCRELRTEFKRLARELGIHDTTH